MSHSKTVVREALLAELAHLKRKVPQTEAVKRNTATIEGRTSPETMTELELRAYVDLWHRSLP